MNRQTSTFVLETESGKDISNCREFYPDIEMLGKHFLVNCTERTWINRHYTTCNAMDPDIYDNLINALKDQMTGNDSRNGSLSSPVMS